MNMTLCGADNPMYGRRMNLCPSWKGDDVGNSGLHDWLRNNLPRSETCQKCGSKDRLEICNIRSEYNKETYTRNFGNWWWGCKKCHKLYDYKQATKKKISEAIRQWHKGRTPEQERERRQKLRIKAIEQNAQRDPITGRFV